MFNIPAVKNNVLTNYKLPQMIAIGADKCVYVLTLVYRCDFTDMICCHCSRPSLSMHCDLKRIAHLAWFGLFAIPSCFLLTHIAAEFSSNCDARFGTAMQLFHLPIIINYQLRRWL